MFWNHTLLKHSAFGGSQARLGKSRSKYKGDTSGQRSYRLGGLIQMQGTSDQTSELKLTKTLRQYTDGAWRGKQKGPNSSNN